MALRHRRSLRLIALAALAVAAGVVACERTTTPIGPPAAVVSVDLTPPSATVQVGQTVQLTAIPRDANGNTLSDRTVTWTSSNTSVATVSNAGVVSAVTPGSATITATSEGKSGTSSIMVTDIPIVSVDVTPPTATVQAGQTVQLTATPRDANGAALSGRAVTWSSNNTSVATVSSSGLVSGVTPGSATITATSEGKSGTSAITVTQVPVATVSVSPPTASIQQGQTVQLTATLKDANGNPLSGRTVTWSSSNTSVATVSSSGLVSGVTPGSATITATSEGKSGTASVTVTWSSSNTAVATVTSSGLVSGVTPGLATITATSEGKTGSAGITVTAPTGGSQFRHVFVVTEENTDYADVIGSSAMPYLNGLAQQYGLATQYYANTHPSIGNYFELATGQIISNNDSYSTIVTADNIVRQLLAAGKTWKSYAEDLPSVGFTGATSGGYARKHNVFALLSDVVNDATQVNNLVPFTQFATDLANGTLPDFVNIAPNLCNDAHDCSLATTATAAGGSCGWRWVPRRSAATNLPRCTNTRVRCG